MKSTFVVVAVAGILFLHVVDGAGARGVAAVASGQNTKRPKNPALSKVQALLKARTMIEKLIADNDRLVPLFVRMGFHDCIDVCDGCIDLADPSNNGLNIPIEALRPVVAKFATPETGLSRTDLWVYASIIATDVAPHGTVSQPVNFTMDWVGRVDCEKANKKCFNAKGKRVPCSATAGPYRPTPAVTFNSKQTLDYFANHFNFSADDTVTIMGFHNLGHLAKKNSGITGPSGWILFQKLLRNEYYQALLGGPPNLTASDAEQASKSPPWGRTLEKNNGKPFPDRHYWSISFQNQTFAMLNTDIAIVRDLNSENTNPVTGEVSCNFVDLTGTPVCPLASTFHLAAQYAADNTFWLTSLKDPWDRMLSNGYVRVPCSQPPCSLELA